MSEKRRTVGQFELYCFSVELAAEACTDHMYSDLEGSKSGREEEEEARNWEHAVVPNVALWNVGFQ
jgi:hypothetical protein